MQEGRRDNGFGADDKPIGVVYSDKRRRWSHQWSEPLVLMIALLATIAIIGAAHPFSWVRMAGALGMLAGAGAISRSDRLHKTSPQRERVWAATGVVLVVGGAVVFGVS